MNILTRYYRLKIIKYLRRKYKVSYITRSSTTNSVYVKLDCGLRIRISDHLSKALSGINIIIYPKIFVLNCAPYSGAFFTLKSIYNKLDLIYGIYTRENFKCNAQTEELANKVLTANKLLQATNDSLTSKNKSQKAEITKLLSKNISYKKELEGTKNTIKKSQDKIAEQKDLLTEAKNLIEELSTRPMIVTDKKYYLDNFPKDVQDFLKDIIKEYY